MVKFALKKVTIPAAIGSLLMWGGITSSHAAEPFTIGVSNGALASSFRTQMIDDLNETNKEYESAGITKGLVVLSADVPVQGQIQQIRNLIARKVNGIIIDPNSATALNPVLREAVEAGIIVVSVDQDVAEPSVINVLTDHADWAREHARWFVDNLKKGETIITVNGTAGSPANETRTDAANALFTDAGIKLLSNVNADWDQAKAQQLVSNVLAAYPQVDAVYSQDGMAQGVLRAVLAANREKLPLVGGEARMGYLRLWNETRKTHPGFISQGVVNSPGIGASGLRVLVDLLQGKKLKSGVLGGASKNSLLLPVPGVVDKDNVDSYLAKFAKESDAFAIDGVLSEDQLRGFFQ
jgi:ribose transport system substrate-binding protein